MMLQTFQAVPGDLAGSRNREARQLESSSFLWAAETAALCLAVSLTNLSIAGARICVELRHFSSLPVAFCSDFQWM